VVNNKDADILRTVRNTIRCRDAYVSDTSMLVSIAEILGVTLPSRTANVRETVPAIPVCIEVGNWYSEYECPRCKVRWVQNDDSPTHEHTCAPKAEHSQKAKGAVFHQTSGMPDAVIDTERRYSIVDVEGE
jgi:hypothetical protein